MKTPWSNIGIIAVLLLAAGAIYYFFSTPSNSLAEDSRNAWFVCGETRKPFQKRIEIGMIIPVESPFSHKPTGFPAEVCYWTREGTIAKTPTYVLLNSHVGSKEPTFCPDCGRLVVGLNPPPVPDRPPPTKDQYERRKAERGRDATR